MLTEQRIQELIALPKTIIGRSPSQGFREDSGSRRCDLDLASSEHDYGISQYSSGRICDSLRTSPSDYIIERSCR